MCLKFYRTKNAWFNPFSGLNTSLNTKCRQYVTYCFAFTLHYSEKGILGYFVESQHLQLYYELAQLFLSYSDVRISKIPVSSKSL